MDPISALSFYLLGVITGASGIIALTIYIGKRALDKRKKETGERTSISDRMKRVKDITEEQLDLA